MGSAPLSLGCYQGCYLPGHRLLYGAGHNTVPVSIIFIINLITLCQRKPHPAITSHAPILECL